MEIERPFPAPSVRHKRRAFRGHGPLTPASFLDAYADALQDRPALFSDTDLVLEGAEDRKLTYEDLRGHAARIAAAYIETGLRPGDRVALLTLNRLEMVVATLAAIRAGMVAVPLNFLLTQTELQSALALCEARALVTDTAAASGRDLPGLGVEQLMLLDGSMPGAIDLPREAARLAPAPPAPAADEDPALIFFTSGTTGEPKGATIPHRALAAVVRRFARVTATLPSPRRQLALLVMPLAHNGGLMGLVTTLCLGLPALVLSRFDAPSLLETIERTRPTVFAGSPAMYRLLLEAGAEGYDLSSMLVWGGGADTFDRELVEAMRSLGGRRLLGRRIPPFVAVGYGASETTGQATMTPPIPVGDRCIGWVLPGLKHRVMGPDGRPVPSGGTGELWLAGDSIMSGYWGDDEATAQALSNGWLRTGDLVRKGRAGLLYYESRRKDVIKSGGYSIASREIEQALESHPGVALAAAVGLPDPVKGERPVAAVTLQPGAEAGAEEIRSWAAEHLAPYKRPRRVVVVDDIPLSAALKPKKAEVRRMLMEMDGSG